MSLGYELDRRVVAGCRGHVPGWQSEGTSCRLCSYIGTVDGPPRGTSRSRDRRHGLYRQSWNCSNHTQYHNESIDPLPYPLWKRLSSLPTRTIPHSARRTRGSMMQSGSSDRRATTRFYRRSLPSKLINSASRSRFSTGQVKRIFRPLRNASKVSPPATRELSKRTRP